MRAARPSAHLDLARAQARSAHLAPADLRREMLGDRESAMELILGRAAARGELGPKALPARVVSLPLDLLRNDLLMTLAQVPPETITAIVDDAFLPLARLSSGLAPD